MENAILKKRLNTFKTDKGTVKRVSDDLLIDILRSWESWTGSSKDYYTELGLSKMQFVVLMKKAKRLCREGYHPEKQEFSEVTLASEVIGGLVPGGSAIEVSWEQGKVIRFTQVDQLVDFLKKVA
jgi:hypothetical protein